MFEGGKELVFPKALVARDNDFEEDGGGPGVDGRKKRLGAAGAPKIFLGTDELLDPRVFMSPGVVTAPGDLGMLVEVVNPTEVLSVKVFGGSDDGRIAVKDLSTSE